MQRTFESLREALATHQLPVAELLDAAEIAPEQWRADDTPLSITMRLWDHALAATGDTTLPLKFGASVPFGRYEVVDYLAAACATLGESWTQLGRCFSVISPSLRWSFESLDGSQRIHLTGSHNDKKANHFYIQYTLGVTLARYHASVVGTLDFEHVALALPPPKDDSAYRDLFGCRPQFDATSHTLQVSNDMWNTPLKGRAAGLQRVLQAHLDELLAQQTDSDAPLIKARIAVREALPKGAPRLAEVASRSAMSERTLQRRLSEAGTTFQALLDDERHQAALKHITNSKLSIGDIAYLLGYSESSALVRAFKRWTDTTPSAYRRNHR